MSVPKKVAAMHDIAGFGRSSLTVVIPTLSALGHQACPIPTAVLSTITGFYEGYELIDLTDSLPAYLAHWEKEAVSFDCIYTGFLASARQCSIADSFIDKFRAPLTVVDPVFADEGKLYSCYDKKIISSMLELIKRADIITPNLTEAAYLLGCDMSSCCADEWARRLSAISGSDVVITGIPDDDNLSVIVYKAKTGETFKLSHPHIGINYPGTGDLFASVLTGRILSGFSLQDAASFAADFTYHSIKRAFELHIPVREGVPLEVMLSRLFEDNRLDIIRL